MADRMLFIGWGAPVRGREQYGLEVFNEAIGICGQMQQEGMIEGFEVRLLGPNGRGLDGYIEVLGSSEQIAAVQEDERFVRNTMDAQHVVENMHHAQGWVGEGIAQGMEMYRDSLAKVPQPA